jgi:hypothetical protein
MLLFEDQGLFQALVATIEAAQGRSPLEHELLTARAVAYEGNNSASGSSDVKAILLESGRLAFRKRFDLLQATKRKSTTSIQTTSH